MIFIGCDGGSTKTEWLLCNERGRVLAHRTFSGCNCAFLGEDGFARLMADSAESLLADAGINAADVASAMFALTGYGEIPGTESSFPAALRAALPGCGQILIDNDSVAGWAGSLAAKPGINVVAGTGSVAYGRDPQRHGYRVGGWSLFFADEGSCSWVARQLITEFVKQTPPDTMVLTLACGKFRFNDLDLGTVAGLPRILDIGQCNDAYSAIQIALALADAFGCGVNELPLSMVLSWYEQKAVCILLTLLYLGIKDIRLGPTLPAFLSPNVLDYLVKNFGIAPITTPEEDLKANLG